MLTKIVSAVLLGLGALPLFGADALTKNLDQSWVLVSPPAGDVLAAQPGGVFKYTSPLFKTVDQFHSFETASLLVRDWTGADRLVVDLANPQDFDETFGILAGPGGDKLRTGMMKVGITIPAKSFRRIVLPLVAMASSIDRSQIDVIHIWTMAGAIEQPFSLLMCGAHVLRPGEMVADLPMPQVTDLGIETVITAADPDYSVVITAQDPQVIVEVVAIDVARRTLSAMVKNKRAGSVDLQMTVGAVGKTTVKKLALKSGTSKLMEIPMPLDGDEFHDQVTLTVAETQVANAFFKASTHFDISSINAVGYGTRLANIGNLTAHACDGTRKVGRSVTLGTQTATGLEVALAAGEREGVQLVLAPPKAAGTAPSEVVLSAGVLRSATGAIIPATAVQIEQVCYLEVKVATADQKMRGWWPDPLRPLNGESTILVSGENTPFLITVHAAVGTPPGVYKGSVAVRIVGQEKPVQVPLAVTVWDFTLPEKNHLRSCFGLIELGNDINAYFDATTPEERRQVRELFLKNFKEHRISPNAQNTKDLIAPPVLTFTPDASAATEVTMDFTNFDRDMAHYLDEYGFDTQTLPMEGMDSFGGHARGTEAHTALWTQYLKAYEAHLVAQGWADKTLVYVYDEPSGEMLKLVQEVYGLIRRVAPRLQTISPMVHANDPNFTDSVSVWCPIGNDYNKEQAAACRARGELTWWYLCLLPKPPHFGIFIDAPSIDQRSWTWRSWDVGATGILMWTTVWWTSPVAFPAGTPRQDPWADPMAYGLGNGNLLPGDKSYMANGDGRYLYPPLKTRNADGTIAAPCNSLRWEAARDGMEDYEYLWMLNSLRSTAGEPDQQVDALLKEINTMFPTATRYDTSVERLSNLRARIAAEIVRRQAAKRKS